MPFDDLPCPCRISCLLQKEQRNPSRLDIEANLLAAVKAYFYDGFLVTLENRTLKLPLVHRCYDTTPCVWLVYQIKGETSVTINERQFCLNTGKMLITNGIDIPREFCCSHGQAIGRVHIRLDDFFLRKYFQYSSGQPPKMVNRMLGTGGDTHFAQIESVSPVVQFALWQLHHFPFDDSLEILFMESRTLDIICEALSFMVGSTSNLEELALSRQDVEKLHHVRCLLLKDVTAPPPGIAELATEIGMNEFKLKKGFRILFKTSIHAYHRNARLDLARTLLSEGGLNVCEVACAVGYSNPSHFCRAFNNLFKINPGAYLRDFRGKGFHLAAGTTSLS